MQTLSVSHLCLNKGCSQVEVFSKSIIIKGIYAWGYKNNNGEFVPLYVGKSKNIHERIIQHYARFKGGEYSIPQVIYKTNIPSSDYSISRVALYEPENLEIVFSLHNTDNIYKNNQEYILLNFRFLFYATTQRTIGEKYLGNKIGAERLISSVPSLNIKIDEQLKALTNDIDAVFSEYYSNQKIRKLEE